MGRLSDRVHELQERVRVLELCLADIERKLKLKRKVPALPPLEPELPTKQVRTGRPGGPVQR